VTRWVIPRRLHSIQVRSEPGLTIRAVICACIVSVGLACVPWNSGAWTVSSRFAVGGCFVFDPVHPPPDSTRIDRVTRTAIRVTEPREAAGSAIMESIVGVFEYRAQIVSICKVAVSVLGPS